nr:PREDICTED: DNA topoisomerase 2 isoform X1 [Bemisia tabaci]
MSRRLLQFKVAFTKVGIPRVLKNSHPECQCAFSSPSSRRLFCWQYRSMIARCKKPFNFAAIGAISASVSSQIASFRTYSKMDGDYLNGGGSGSEDEVVQAKPKGKKMSVERIYQKKSQLEHILLRPDTYIGSVEFVKEPMWIYDEEENRMIQKEISYVPGLYKIFDEILVNAADNKQRDPKMDRIKIDISQEDNTITIYNNGQGIPVVEHKDEKMYVPTMIFGHLLTSSNYNDEEEKVTGGRNGFGAKLCNIFSTKFTVETSSQDYKKCFKQTWTSNMTKTSAPQIIASKGEDYTKIKFSPDLTKFKMDKLDDDIVALMKRRAYDVAATTGGVKVVLNGKLLPVKSFKDYVDLYVRNLTDDSGNALKVVHEKCGPRWEVAITVSDKGFQQMSFANSIATTKGGRHVDHVTDVICKQLMEVIKKKSKGTAVKPHQVKNHMWVFVNCLIVNPTFDSQTKEHMTLQVKSFGSKPTISEKFFTAVNKVGIVDMVLAWSKFKEQNALGKTSGKKQSKLKGIPKLEDANDAGTKNSIDCTLILTEGDSAKALAVSGLGVVGRDRYGVFPLRGKLLNVREATTKQVMENNEISSIVKILGLIYKKKYETTDDLRTLRYGKLMIMTDQDQDGSHIKGLIINFIHHNWPGLLRLPFLQEFITPIVKVKKSRETLSFYSLPEFEEWKAATPNFNTWNIKYYKGLGTSSSDEAREYFSNMNRHRILFIYRGPEDDAHITMAFSKKLVDSRKEWLTNWMSDCKRRREMGLPEDYLYEKDTRAVSYQDFINKELVLFSNMDNERSIPSMVDGLKPGSRKVLFTCFKRNDKKEVKVAQLAGSVAEHSAYHHGEMSLTSTIVNLAQNFVGSNNINLLMPNGQFGTRLQGGKDAASPRYIFTMLSPLARYIFHPDDDPLLTYLRDDNKRIEPEWYIPIIPMVLVNGAEGIGTGWMTKIPNYNPREIAANLKLMINGEDPKPMLPWYKNFIGNIENIGESRFVTTGIISQINEDKIEVTELPIGVWTQNYKEGTLEVMLNGTEKEKGKDGEKDKTPPLITDYKEYSTDTKVRFLVSMNRDMFIHAENEGFFKVFKLQNTISTSSMVAFDRGNCLKKYDTVMQIMREFFDVRLEFYEKRKAYMEGMLLAEAQRLSDQARFICEKCDGDLRIENRKKKEMIAELVKREYRSDPVKEWRKRQQKDEEQEEDADQPAETETAQGDQRDYDYLLGMPMWNLTYEKKEELLKKEKEKKMELKILQDKTPRDLWRHDLDVFLEKLDEVEQDEIRKAEENFDPKKKGSKKKVALKAEALPSPAGKRIEFKIDEELRNKVRKLEQAKVLGSKKREAKKEAVDIEKDDFDLLVENGSDKPLAARLGTSPEMIEKKIRAKKEKAVKAPKAGKGQSKITDTFKAKSAFSDSDSDDGKKKKGKKKVSPKKKGKKSAFSDSDDDLLSDGSVASFRTSPVSVPSRATARRAAANIKFNFDDSDGEEKLESDVEVYDNIAVTAPSAITTVTNDIASDFSDKGSDSDSEPAPKPKKAAPKKRKEKEDSDSEPTYKPKKAAALKKKAEDDFDKLLQSSQSSAMSKDEDSGDEFDKLLKGSAPISKEKEPAKKPATSYKFSDDEDDDDVPLKSAAPTKAKDSDDEFEPDTRPKKPAAASKYYEGSDSESDFEPAPKSKKPAASRKRKDSDSEFELESKSKKAKTGKRKLSSDDSDADTFKSTKKGGGAKKKTLFSKTNIADKPKKKAAPKKKKYSDSDFSDF